MRKKKTKKKEERVLRCIIIRLSEKRMQDFGRTETTENKKRKKANQRCFIEMEYNGEEMYCFIRVSLSVFL